MNRNRRKLELVKSEKVWRVKSMKKEQGTDSKKKDVKMTLYNFDPREAESVVV